MKTLVIQTQYRENYAAHNEDYVQGVSLDYWKFKGGSTYIVTDLTAGQIAKIEANGIPALTDLIEYSNGATEEYILDWEIRDLGKNGDGKGPICESWETPIRFTYRRDEQLAYNGWHCSTHHTFGDDEYIAAPIRCKAEQWIPTSGGDRLAGSYACQYKTPSGWLDADSEQLKQEVENAKMEAV
jgi:hypothetical protein